MAERERRQAKPDLPRWLKWVNPVVMSLNKRGLAVGTMEVLTTTGRRSGKLISNPVSVLIVDGERYLCTVGDTSWVLNARADPRVTLQRGRRKYAARLIEVPEPDRGKILREFPVAVPGGVAFFRRSLGISGTPESFEQAADRCPVFRIESLRPGRAAARGTDVRVSFRPEDVRFEDIRLRHLVPLAADAVAYRQRCPRPQALGQARVGEDLVLVG
jgi:deazaflavin-dependent oxidoreductase (nitroreductase family)